jgi:Flp pilus assembly protein TadD
LDLESCEASAGLARSHYRDVLLGTHLDRNNSVAQILAAAKRAVELDRMDSHAHMRLVIAYHYAREFEPALAEAETAVN